MDNKIGKIENRSNTIRAYAQVAFLFYAILPITESIDWLYYVLVAIILTLFIVAIFLAIRTVVVDKSNLLKLLHLRKEDKIISIAIPLAGLIVAFSMQLKNMIFVWAFFLVLEIISIAIGNPPDASQEKD